jgi:glycosyltransferase involved in cell wall biosynthesis
MKPRLSALLIAKDEEQDLPACLESLRGLADEIVLVLDDRSADATEALAAAAGAKILRRRFDNYASQRQAGLEAASGEWCLWIDCDETLGAALRAELPEALSSSRFDAWTIPFSVSFLGRTLRWGGLGSERHLRLFRREKARFTGGGLHEGAEVDGRTGALKGEMLHIPYRDLSDYLSKLDRYTTLAARKRFSAGCRAHWWHHLLLPWEFISRGLLKLGFLDGRAGLFWAALAAFHSWLKYAKLREMESAR